jgi:acetolactate synthase-1/2/3 large subunit
VAGRPPAGGAAVVRALEAHGVRHVFGIPGTHNLELYRALAAGPIRHVVTRHEQGAGYAADGYARTTGRPGVVITTSGPGLTNAATAVATAYADSVPLLVISPGVPRGMERRDLGWLHEVKDQRAALDALCERSVRCESAEQAAEAVADTFARWRVTRPRPVHLEIPVDVLEEPWTGTGARPRPAAGPVAAPAETVAAAAALLGAADRPVIVAGGGGRGAAGQVRRVAELLDAPVVTTVNGKGVLDEEHPLAVGAAIRLPAAQDLIEAADAVLVVGSELGDSDTWGWRPVTSGRVVRVDLDPGQLHKNLPADVPVPADAAPFLDALAAALATGPAAGAGRPAGRGAGRAAAARAGAYRQALRDGARWAPLQAALRGALPPDVVVAGDSSQVTYLGTVHFWPFDRPGRLLYPTGYATLGYGLPAAVGAKIGDPARPVVAVIGDGAFMFSVQELMTAAEQRLALPVLVVDNGGFGEIRDQMVERGIPPLAVDLDRPDLPGLARAMGCRGEAADGAAEAAALLAEGLAADRPTVVSLAVGP